ncbi:MAG TPA: hypothetical protein VH301_06490 [Usitatibacter sp.]|jgi:hypothetical protein|nr:hypothetical protein [Usitatibacter sp.]
MSTIIAGGFDVLADAEAAVRRLEEAGVSRDDLCRFRINPAGEHNALPAGGDRDASPGAKKASGGAGKGAAIGAAVGLAAGAAATPFLGPAGLLAGAGVGAYTGSLWGSLKEIDKERPAGHDDVRPAETLVAVNVDRTGLARDDIVGIFEQSGARQVETAEGTWIDGEWADFDPVSSPHLVGGRDYGVRPRPGA